MEKKRISDERLAELIRAAHPLVGTKPFQRTAHPHDRLLVEPSGGRFLGHRTGFGIDTVVSPAAAFADGPIVGDAIEPRGESARTPKSAEVFIRSDESLLRDILGPLRIAHHGQRQGVDPPRITVHQLAERLCVAGLHTPHNLHIGRGLHSSDRNSSVRYKNNGKVTKRAGFSIPLFPMPFVAVADRTSGRTASASRIPTARIRRRATPNIRSPDRIRSASRRSTRPRHFPG